MTDSNDRPVGDPNAPQATRSEAFRADPPAVPVDRLPADRAPADRMTADRMPTDRVSADRTLADPPAERFVSERPGRAYDPSMYRPVGPAVIGAPALAVRRDLVRWGPIVAGLATALTTLILLSLLAVALGITAVDTGTTGTQSDVLSIGAAATAAIIGVISFFIGGVVAARTAAIDGRGAGALNGFLVWALGVMLILALAAMGLGAILGAAGNVVGATGIPNVNTPNVNPNDAATIGRNSALGAFISLAVPAIAAAIGGAVGARTRDAYAEDAG